MITNKLLQGRGQGRELDDSVDHQAADQEVMPACVLEVVGKPCAEDRGRTPSSSPSEPAQESDSIRGSFFTHALISGLRGAADVDRDGLVTLGEAYRFAYDETLASTETTIGGAQHPAFEIQLAGTRDLVLTDLRAASAKVEVDANVRGHLSFRDSQGRLEAELDKRTGDALTLAIPPGRYEVTAVDHDSASRANLSTGRGTTRLRRADFYSLPLTETTSRAGGNNDRLNGTTRSCRNVAGVCPGFEI